MTGGANEQFRACGDVLLHHVDGAWMLSNPRTRCHVELDRAAIAAFTAHAEGAPTAVCRNILGRIRSKCRLFARGREIVSNAAMFDRELGQIVQKKSDLHITGSLTFESAGTELPAELDLRLTMGQSTSK